MAGYRIPSDDDVRGALTRIFQTRHQVPSQRNLKALVEKDLATKETFRVGEERLRHLAIDSGLIGLEIHTREAVEKKSILRCPVCEGRVKRLRNMTVFGGTVTLGFRCPKCGYWSGLRRRVPTRYVFTAR